VIEFHKMHGLGNDFIIVDCRDGAAVPSADIIMAMGDRKTGIGCDQFIILSAPKSADADIFMQIVNAADGIEVEACGNATRCVASLLMQETGQDAIVVETVAGLLHCAAENAGKTQIAVNMGAATHDDTKTFFGRDGYVVSIGNPHIIFFVDDVMAIDLEGVGPQIETDDVFPNRTNVEFAQIIGDDEIRMRVWERGEGITQACGTGACATGAAAIKAGLGANPVTIVMDGGALTISEKGGDIYMSGPASYVCRGVYAPSDA